MRVPQAEPVRHTNTSNNSEPDFDSSGDNAFNLILNSNYNNIDGNIEVD